MKRTTFVLLALVLAMLLSACAMPGVTPTAQESNPSNLEKGNNYNADMENVNNTNESTARVWPWEDPNITLPEFTGEVTAPGTITSLKIVVVGDASARDAWSFFPELAKEAGIDVKVTVLYGANDLSAIYNGKTTYTRLDNTGNGWVTAATGVTQESVLKGETWDYYVANQSIAKSGVANTYTIVNNLYRNVFLAMAGKSINSKRLFMQTWAYEINDRNNLYNGFGTYNKDQEKMFADINSSVKSGITTSSNVSKVATNANNDGVLPVGTAIQNMRAAYWSDGMTRDAEFLSNTGKVVAALCLFKSITGYDINGMELSSSVFDHARPHLGVIKESVNNAYLHPYEVTPSVYHTDFN